MFLSPAVDDDKTTKIRTAFVAQLKSKVMLIMQEKCRRGSIWRWYWVDQILMSRTPSLLIHGYPVFVAFFTRQLSRYEKA